MIKLIILIIIGFILLIKGADFLVEGASKIAKRFGIPEMIVGLTIVSIGTSMPELFVSVTSALNGFSDVSVGNVVGSNLCNLLLILGITTLIKDIKFEKTTKYIDIPFMIFTTFIFYLVARNGIITKMNGWILIALFIVFITYTIISAKRQNKNDKECMELIVREKEVSILKSILSIMIGIVALKFGGEFVVDNATLIAKSIGISEKVISVTIIAIGTSLPELVTSVMAAIKGNTDMSIGNIIGSNIFNILLIIGVSSVIQPIWYNLSYNFDLIILTIGSFCLFLSPHLGKKEYLTKKGGITFLILYAGYMVKLLIG